MNLNKLLGYGLAFMSGMLLTIVTYLNNQTSKIKHEVLQAFYSNCICACFSPFFILKGISDRKRVTKYD